MDVYGYTDLPVLYFNRIFTRVVNYNTWLLHEFYGLLFN